MVAARERWNTSVFQRALDKNRMYGSLRTQKLEKNTTQQKLSFDP